MTPPPDASTTAIGRDGAGGTRPVRVTWRALLRWSIVAAFVLRGALGLLDARSAAVDAVRSLPFVSSNSIGTTSPLLPLLLGLLALAVAASLAMRIRVAWLLALGVTVAYLVSGISDVTALVDTAADDPWQTAMTVAVGLVTPLLVFAGLLAIREWYLPASRPIPHVHLHRHERRTPLPQPAATGGTLDRWRRGG